MHILYYSINYKHESMRHCTVYNFIYVLVYYTMMQLPIGTKYNTYIVKSKNPFSRKELTIFT